MKREYLDYIQDILEAISDIEVFIKGMDLASFRQDKKTVNAVIRSLEIIGEAAKKVPDEIGTRYETVPWKDLAGMRDKLIHEYFGVDEEIVWKVASEEISALRPAIDKLFEELNKDTEA